MYTTDEAGNKTSQNIIGNQDNVIAEIRYDDGQHVYFYSKDIQGSTSVITDENGDYVCSYDYTDYGETTKNGNADFYNEICYTGSVYDELTGLYYLNSRYYSPDTGSFLSQDTYRGESSEYTSWNLYAYCAGNPVKYVDPSGHFSSSQASGRAKHTYYYNTGNNIPKQASYEEYQYDNIKVGDIIFEGYGGYGITGHIAIVEKIIKDENKKIKCIKIIEAIDKGVCYGILDDIRIYEKGVEIYRVRGVTKRKRRKAVAFCREQVGKEYFLDLKKNESEKEKNWYCSELVWAAYKNQNINIETTDLINEPGVTPRDIKKSKQLKKIKLKKRVYYSQG